MSGKRSTLKLWMRLGRRLAHSKCSPYNEPMHKTKSGFTIVELLIVIVVIGILAAITIVAYNGIQQRGRDTRMISDLTNASKQLELYNVDNVSFPTSVPQLKNIGIRFSVNPAVNTVMYCGDNSGYAIFTTENGKQYKMQKGQSAMIQTPNLSWSGTPLCSTTPYPAFSWGDFWVANYF